MSFGRSILRGGHLSREAIPHPSAVSVRDAPYRHFSHLILSPQWSWSDLGDLRSESIKARLENGGSVTAHAGLFPDGQPMVVTVGGRPPYLDLARRFAAWFEQNQNRFMDAPSTAIRGLGVAAAAINAAVSDSDAVPRAISPRRLRSLLQPYVPADQVMALRAWIEGGNYTSSIASLQQAKLWLAELHVGMELTPRRAIDYIYDSLLRVREEGYDSESVDRLFAILADGAASISTRAIVAESLTSGCDTRTLAKVAGSARLLQKDLESLLVDDNPPLEPVCLITAALVRILASGGLVSVPPPEAFD
jgi:hypothetical protein